MTAPIESQFGLPLSTTSREAASLYRDAIDRTHGAQAGARELLAQAISLDPTFAVAHATLWMHANAEGDTAAAAGARDAALSSSAVARAWERSHFFAKLHENASKGLGAVAVSS